MGATLRATTVFHKRVALCSAPTHNRRSGGCYTGCYNAKHPTATLPPLGDVAAVALRGSMKEGR